MYLFLLRLQICWYEVVESILLSFFILIIILFANIATCKNIIFRYLAVLILSFKPHFNHSCIILFIYDVTYCRFLFLDQSFPRCVCFVYSENQFMASLVSIAFLCFILLILFCIIFLILFWGLLYFLKTS